MHAVVVVVVVAALYQGVVVLAVSLGWRVPRVPARRDPGSLGLVFEPVGFSTVRGKTLRGWWIPSGRPGAPCLILVHGWRRNAARMLPWVELLHPIGYDLLVFDARHHGASDGDGYASLPKFSEDIRAAADYAESRGAAGARGIRVGVLGLSLGGSAAIHAAALDHRIAAVATVGSLGNAADPRAIIGRRWWVLAPGLPLALWLVERRVGFRFRDVSPERHIGNARARFLLIHGVDDVIVPVSHARRLAAAAGASARTWFVPGRGHSDVHREPGMAEALRGFFGEALAAPEATGLA